METRIGIQCFIKMDARCAFTQVSDYIVHVITEAIIGAVGYHGVGRGLADRTRCQDVYKRQALSRGAAGSRAISQMLRQSSVDAGRWLARRLMREDVYKRQTKKCAKVTFTTLSVSLLT